MSSYKANVYVVHEKKNEAVLVGKQIPFDAMMQISKRFEREEQDLDTVPHDKYTLAWDFSNDDVSVGGARTYFSWIESLTLPLPDNFHGRKAMPLENWWGIQQFRSVFEVMQYLDLKLHFGHEPVRGAIYDWVEGDDLSAKELIGLWRATDEKHGLRKLIVHCAVEWCYKHQMMDECKATFQRAADHDGYADLLEKWQARRKEKDEWARRQRRGGDRRRGEDSRRREVPGSELV